MFSDGLVRPTSSFANLLSGMQSSTKFFSNCFNLITKENNYNVVQDFFDIRPAKHFASNLTKHTIAYKRHRKVDEFTVHWGGGLFVCTLRFVGYQSALTSVWLLMV